MKFFELTPLTLKRIEQKAESDTRVKNLMFGSGIHTTYTVPLGKLIGWLQMSWPEVTQADQDPLEKTTLAPPSTTKIIDAATQQQMKILQVTQTRAKGTIPTVSQEGEPAHQQTTGTGNTPFNSRGNYDRDL